MTFLAVVQAKLEPEAYRDARAFTAWIEGQTAKALESRDANQPALIALPELIGLPLLFFLNRESRANTAQEAGLELLRESWLEALRLSINHRHVSISNLILPRAVMLHQTLLEAFSNAAQKHNAFIVAGSSFLPCVDDEAAKGVHVVNPRVQNVSYLFAPNGRLFSRTPKINLTSGLESRLALTPGRLEDWQPAHTPLGRIGTLICYDAFFDACIAKADSSSTQILVQPSANAARWDGPWSADKTQIEGEQWIARGAGARIQNAINIRVLLNPMLVGKLFDLEFEGRSSITFNQSLEPKASNYTSSPTEFAVINANTLAK
jgi:predicted amidohydrolase